MILPESALGPRETAARETTKVHTRLLKCALEVEDSRAYWQHTDGSAPVDAHAAFESYWFGARSLDRIKVLLTNLRERFDAFPPSLAVLHRWDDMSPDARRLVCHWHTQLADPVYRAFTGEYLVERREGARPAVTRDLVTKWVGERCGDRLTMTTRIQFASKLLSSACAAGLVATTRDPRPLIEPRVSEPALEYVVYLLRGVHIAGTLLDNPYLRSVGLRGGPLEERLRALSAVELRRQGDLVELAFRYPDLATWAAARCSSEGARA